MFGKTLKLENKQMQIFIFIMLLITSTFDNILELILNFKFTITTTLFCFILFFLLKKQPRRKVYLLDYVCYKPPASQMCTKDIIVKRARKYIYLSQENVDFMRKTMERAGLGDSTYLPEALLNNPPNMCMAMARREAEMAMFGCIDTLLAKTGLRCQEIGILVVNCAIFNVMPSLSSMIVNRYKLRDDIISYNLTGMGCSAGLVAIGLAKQLLQVHRDSYALVVSTENITENTYMGDNRSMILINCLFRIGGAAILLSNRPSDRQSSKYELIQTVHTHTASSDCSYDCIVREEDHEGRLGINVTKDLLVAANKAIESNLNTLGSLVLPLTEQIRFTTNYIMRKLWSSKIQLYVPDFKKATDHFCTHVGGKPVMDELQRILGFTNYDMEPSRMTMYRFGNTSSSSIWYELAYAEAKGRIKKGQRVWQIAFGAGFKCSSVIWRATRSVGYDETNPWTAEIDQFPVDLDNIGSFTFYFESPKEI